MIRMNLRSAASTLACAVALLAIPSLSTAATPTPAAQKSVASARADEAAIRAVIERYRASVETLDPAIIDTLWLHNEQVTFIHPRGHERGWNGVWRQFYQGTMGLFSQRKFDVRDVQVFQHGSVAYVEFYWDFVATLKTGGEPLHTEGRENQLLVRTPSGWRISNVHYSGMPVTGERQGF